MSWRRWIGSFPVVVGLGVCGCESGGAFVSANEPGWAAAVAETGGGVGSRARGGAEAEAADPPAGNVQTVAAAGSAFVRPAARIRARVNNEIILDEEVRNAVYQEMRAAEELPEPERSRRKV